MNEKAGLTAGFSTACSTGFPSSGTVNEKAGLTAGFSTAWTAGFPSFGAINAGTWACGTLIIGKSYTENSAAVNSPAGISAF